MSAPSLFAAPARLRRLQVEITTGCNLNCAGCQRTLGMQARTWRNAHMPAARLDAVLANAPPAATLILQGIGEPTLHPGLADLIAAARRCRKFDLISFNTNALARDADYYAHLRRHGLNHVSISVDSLIQATADRLRAGTDCTRLRANAAALLRVFEGSVTFSIVLSRGNAAELPSLLATLHGLGARVIEVQPLVSYATATDDLTLDPAALRASLATIEAARATLPGLTVLPAPAFAPDGSRCRRPFHAAYVTVDGFLTPCCLTNDPDLLGRTSLAELPWEQAWDSAGVRGFLSRYFDREPAICQGCAFNPSGTQATVSVADARRQLADGSLDQAAVGFQTALAHSDAAEALQGLGLVHLQRGDPASALPLLQAAGTLAPGPRCSHNIAAALTALGRQTEAVALHRDNLARHPDYVPAYLTLAGLLATAGDRGGAGDLLVLLASRALSAQQAGPLRTAVSRLAELDPGHRETLLLANRLRIAGQQGLALDLLDARLARDPGDLGAALCRTMARLAVVHTTEEDVTARRAAYTQDLQLLAQAAHAADPAALARAAEQVGTAKPFFLAYQGQDDRLLQQTYGDLVVRMMAAAHPRPAPHPPPPSPRIRVGFATAYWHLHSVSKLFGGWVRSLDRSRFEVIGYHLGDGQDAMSADLAGHCQDFRHGVGTRQDWARTIADDGLHALIYPEIGMHPLAVQLASQRLAPVQCVAWGHPVTTGLPTIDAFLSSALMEPPDGDRHYTERLVRLPNLSVCYQPLPSEGGRLSRSGLGIPHDAVAYLCCQSLFKYRPSDDAVLVAIATQVPNAVFVFIGDLREVNATLVHRRMSAAFTAAGLDAARLRFVPPVAAEAFPSLLRAADVYLDSIGWSGGNTTLEAVACDLPMITLPTGLMRGRHSAAILRMMGLEAWIAADRASYVTLAVALAVPAKRALARQEIAARRHLLYGDTAPVRALEAFLTQVVDTWCARP